MANSLPRYFSVVGSGTDSQYMEFVHEDGTSHGLFIARGKNVLSPFAKLELVDAANGRVHIRCCYNNKFLAVRSETDLRISAVADEPVTDQSSWSCTMFRVTRSNTNQQPIPVAVEHVHLGRKLVINQPDNVLMVYQSTGIPDFYLYNVSWLLDLGLPQFVTFKADNDNYAQVLNPSAPNVNFGTSGSSWNENMVYEILGPRGLGDVKIRSFSNNKCWRSKYSREPVVADSDKSDFSIIDTETDFTIRRIDANNNVVAIRSFGGFLMRDTTTNNLIPGARTHDDIQEARFEMEEAVRSRSLYNVRYNIPAARVFLGHPNSISTQTMINESSIEQSMERTFTYTETITTNWNFTISAKYGISATIKAKVPLLSEASLTTSFEFSGAYEQGKEHTTSETKEDKVITNVPPRTTVYVSRWETEGSYDVPFSYTQDDVLVTGQRKITEKHDGLAIGVNNCDIFYRVREEPITTTTKSEAREYVIVPQTSRILPS